MKMETLLVDYKFDDLRVKSLTGGFELAFKNSTIVSGPGNTSIGKYAKAVDLGTSGKANVNLTGLRPNSKQFCLQVVFKVNGPVRGRRNIVESNYLPFALFADKGKNANSFTLTSSVKLQHHGWSAANTEFKKTLKTNKWLTVSLVYDLDTLGLFIDSEIVSIHGFPKGAIKTNTTKELYFGTWVDGSKHHLKGAIAGFKWFNQIPSQLESLLDERRSNAEWHITYKHAQIKNKINMGKPLQAVKYDSSTGAHTLLYQNGGIMFHESAGAAFEMHGQIYNRFKSMRNKSALGFLVTDESAATHTSGRKNLFSKGGIYWSRSTGAVPVLGEIYLEFENLGESKAFGFPLRAESAVPGGKEQRFQKCRMYYKIGAGRAQEVHGAILKKFLSTGGLREWGFPITNESDVKKGRRTIGKSSEFERATFYWKSGIGAFEVHGSIRQKYMDLNGPIGIMGFPTSNEVDIPNHSGAGRINTFEKGSILWFGSFASIKVARPFKIRIQRIHSRESEGITMGQNDIHFYATIKDGTRQVYRKRFPKSGDFGGHNVINPHKTLAHLIVPNKLNMRISFSIDIRDSDPGADDHLGKKTTMLTAANAWGFKQTDLVFNQSFSKIQSFLWSLRLNPVAGLTERQKWWKFDNFRTPQVTKAQYAAAYRDVDSETEWWDLLDGLKTLYYKWVVKGIGSDGNCFGVSLEAIYARKCMSLFNQPLNQVTNNSTSKNEITIKHSYQVGARPIWWFLGQFVSGNTHDPKDVFLETRNAFRRGDNPVVCISQNYDFSGGPHCIMPYAWHTNSKPWKMKVMDPNFPGDETKEITVDPDRGTFRYVGSRTYSGSSWSGGRFHYMPFCILDTPQRTPVWDAILLILSGTILILADDAETVSIKDANGKDLNGNGARAKSVIKSGNKPEEFFASFVGFDVGKSLKPGQIMLRRESLVTSSVNSDVINSTGLTLSTLVDSRRLRGFTARSLPSNPTLKNALLSRSSQHILNDKSLARVLPVDFKNNLKAMANINAKRNYQHVVKGAKTGKLEYTIKSGLNEITIKSVIRKNELNTIKVNDLNTSACAINFISTGAKKLELEIINKLGVNGDHVKMNVRNIPVKANGTVDLNIRQGLGGLEIVNKGSISTLPVKLSGRTHGKIIEKEFTIPAAEAIRIKPSVAVNSNELAVSNIDRLFGTASATRIIRKN